MPPAPLARLALGAITLYQRHLSPRKGYCCALHALGGGRSCSAYGYRAVARAGLLTGVQLLRRRFAACARVSSRSKSAEPLSRLGYPLARQGGFCDLDCGGCDIPGGCSHGGDVLDCCTGISPCDLPWRRSGSASRNDHLNNENALRERIRQAQARRKALADKTGGAAP